MEDLKVRSPLYFSLLSKNKNKIRDFRYQSTRTVSRVSSDEMNEEDLEIASEFIAMAAHLTYIRRRWLLTSDEAACFRSLKR